MRKGKTLRINEELLDMIKDLTQIYRNYYNYNRLSSSSIMEKIVINGLPSYIEDLKKRQKENPETMTADKIKNIEKKLHNFINRGRNENMAEQNSKLLSFVTEEKLHECIDELATAEAKALQLNIGYTTLVTGMIVKGADFYIDLAEQYLEQSEINKIKDIREYIDNLDLDLNYFLRENIEDKEINEKKHNSEEEKGLLKNSLEKKEIEKKETSKKINDVER